MTKYNTLKLKLKELATEIRELKSKRKTSPNGYVRGIISAKRRYRIGHVIMCLARGRTYEEIEKPTRADSLDLDALMLEANLVKEERDEIIRARMQDAA